MISPIQLMSLVHVSLDSNYKSHSISFIIHLPRGLQQVTLHVSQTAHRDMLAFTSTRDARLCSDVHSARREGGEMKYNESYVNEASQGKVLIFIWEIKPQKNTNILRASADNLAFPLAFENTNQILIGANFTRMIVQKNTHQKQHL